jgi:hypothetical protein
VDPGAEYGDPQIRRRSASEETHMSDYGHDLEFGVFITPAAQSADDELP